MRFDKNNFILTLTVIFAVLFCASCSTVEKVSDKRDQEVTEKVNDTVTTTPVTKEPLTTVTPEVTAAPDETSGETTEPISSEPEPTQEAEKENGNVIVVLDPGHGGKFTGAMYSGMVEKDMTFFLAGQLRDYLLENYDGIEVYMTRNSDIELADDLVTELENRAINAKELNADYFVSLHFNACDEHNQTGAAVYASRRANVTEKSQKLAKSVLAELIALGIDNNGIGLRPSSDHFDEDGSALDYYAVLRHSSARDIPAIIVEHCFMDNPHDQEFINSDEKLTALAVADAKGIAKCLELKEKDSSLRSE